MTPTHVSGRTARLLLIPGLMAGLFATSPLGGTPATGHEVPLGTVIAAQGNAALATIREESRIALLEQSRPQLPPIDAVASGR